MPSDSLTVSNLGRESAEIATIAVRISLMRMESGFLKMAADRKVGKPKVL
jgi:hypothetical protein